MARTEESSDAQPGAESGDVREAASAARQQAAEARKTADAARSDADPALTERARDHARQAIDDAAHAKHEADRASHEADATYAMAQDTLDELLIHPTDAPEAHGDEPFGTPGEPISRRAPFYVGFVGTLGVLAALLVGLAIRAAGSVLVLILVSVFLAVGLNPVVEWLILRGFRRRWSVLLVTIGVLLVATLFVVALVPVIQAQVTTIIANAPDWLDQLQRNRTVQRLDGKYDVIATLQQRLQDADVAKQAFGSLFAAGLAVLNAMVNAFLVFVLTLYFLSALPDIKRACYSLAPESRRTRVTYLGDEILRRVGGYVAGAFVVALCAGVASFIFLEIVGLGQYAVALALVVAILDFIPLIGATIGAAIVSIIGFATSPTIGVICVVFYLCYQQVENYVLYPRIMASSVDVPGVVTVVAVLIGGSLIGVVGAMLAIPTAAAALLLIREIWVRRVDDA
jgi:predicted PurR-regulated permease PerM